MFRWFREGREKQRQEQATQRLEEERVKWLTMPIEDQRRFIDYQPPSFEDLANRAIERAGPDAEFDPDAVPVYFIGLWLTLATKVLEGENLSSAARGLWIIPRRDDFKHRMLWDYLTMQGPMGDGIHLFMTNEIQSNGYIEEVVKAIRSGKVRDAEAVSRAAFRRN